jgi:acyl carrier protein
MDKQARILDDLTQLFRDIFVDDEIAPTPQTTAADVPGWDSVKHIEIVIAIEEKYGFRFSSREVDGLRSVGDLIAVIERKRS